MWFRHDSEPIIDKLYCLDILKIITQQDVFSVRKPCNFDFNVGAVGHIYGVMWGVREGNRNSFPKKKNGTKSIASDVCLRDEGRTVFNPVT